MWFIDGFVRDFAALYNKSAFTGALIWWGIVLSLTAAVTMYDSNSGRRKLWGFLISTIGAVGILMYVEYINMKVHQDVLKGVITNFVVMTLGGLGAGLLAVAITEDVSKSEDIKFRDGLFNFYDCAFVFVGLSSLSIFSFCLVSEFLGRTVATEHELSGMLVTSLGALIGWVITACRHKIMRYEALAGILLFLFFVFILIIYAQALSGVWELASIWVFTLIGLIGAGLAGALRLFAAYSRAKIIHRII
ncbi:MULTISPECIES: hypothetical protein [unclassified Pseudomonas]|uniref:hypothetical protein n=1 Tax=unclassified Pseudomonas TaxID=196821 RepID=UPI0015A3160C|nr:MULTISPECIES: hypothetical protein [unclassified Pseudomonas]NWC93601.1 hypothetical protein [Pseudomonas sp. IPO3779]NWD18432.1 hypothetical protein [Pseudomonas sp. IPO3778]